MRDINIFAVTSFFYVVILFQNLNWTQHRRMTIFLLLEYDALLAKPPPSYKKPLRLYTEGGPTRRQCPNSFRSEIDPTLPSPPSFFLQMAILNKAHDM